MILRVIVALLVFLILLSSLVFVLEGLPGEPVKLKVNYLEPESLDLVEYSAVPIFAENMRFNHNLISYFIDSNCDKSRRDDMAAAFNIFSDKVKIISFYEGGIGSDIKISCSNEFVELGEDLFAAGEGGPSRIINTSGFKVIEEGTILLYAETDCGYPTIALHELCHVFGFDHSPDPNNIMFNTSGCGQRMSDDMIELMQELYSIEPLPDARVESVSGVISGRYLDFNISILNEGLIRISSISLTILADGETADVFDLNEFNIGYGRTLKVLNMRLPRNVEKLQFVVDIEDLVKELNEENNIAELIV
jgi:hypothetical protein